MVGVLHQLQPWQSPTVPPRARIDRSIALAPNMFSELRVGKIISTRLPSSDGSAPLRLRRTVRRRVRLERRRAHPAAHVGWILSGTDDCARYFQVVRRWPNRNASSVGSDRGIPWLGLGGKDGGKQFGRLGPAGCLGCGGGSGRRSDGQIGLGHIQPGLK